MNARAGFAQAAVFGVLGLNVPVGDISAQCTPIHSSFTGTAATGSINLVYSGQSSLLSQAAGMWNGTCDTGVPEFEIRSQSQPGAVNVAISITSGTPSACTAGQCARGVTETLNGVLVGGEVHIDSSCGKETVAHELGHFLGLDDTFHPSCVDRIMYGSNVPAGLATVQPGDCDAVDDLG